MPRPLRFAALVSATVLAGAPCASHAQSISVGGVTYTNKGLQGAGRVSASSKDKFGETFGSLSGLALDLRTLTRSSGGTYSATLYTQPDRGYVKSGVTTNYRARTNKISFSFKPDTNGSSNQDQVTLTLSDTTLLTEDGSANNYFTGMDPSATTTGTRAAFGSLKLPQAFNGHLSLDAEGLVLLPDGTFFVSDEYGPYIYRFSASGALLGVVRPPEALIPKRNNTDSFSSDNPAAGQPPVSPIDPTAGRANNKGLEGLSLSADGRTLYALMQAAARQDTSSGQNRFTRLLAYDVSIPASPALTFEWVLTLPLFSTSTADVAEAHEILALGSNRFLVLAHDGNGRGSTITKSTYRAVLLYDTSSATNIARDIYDNPTSPLAQNGVLANDITPATGTVLVDVNDTANNGAQLAKFGLNNNANDDSNTLSNAWESLALLPALDAANPDDFFLLIGNDNNFSTSSGFQDGASYNASPNIDSMVLAYRVTLPGVGYLPIITTQPASATAAAGATVNLTVAASGSPTPTFQWSKSGTPISGATSATLTLPNVQTSDNGSYTVVVTNANGSVTSTAAVVNVASSSAPTITTQPASQTVASGATAVFSVAATNAISYQWSLNNTPITGATSSTLVIPGATSANAGTYSVSVSGSSAVAFSNGASLTISTASDVGRLSNLSVLTDITASVPSFTLGTVVSGGASSATKPLVVRAAGPALAAFTGSSAGLLPDPKLDLFIGQTVVVTNDNWGIPAYTGAATATEITNAMASVGAFAFPAGSKDAAAYGSAFTPNNYTVQVSGVGGATGTVIAEVYDATPSGTFSSATPRLINVSVLKQINANGSITLGFTIGGATAKTVLIRAIGPGLAAVGVPASAALADPSLTLFNSSSVAIATNDNWGGDAALTSTMTRVNAFGGFSATSKDAMLLITLPPGGYTARASGGAGSGLVIVEAYEVP